MKVLVIGAGGQVGEKVGAAFGKQGHVAIGAYKSRKPSSSFVESYSLDKVDQEKVQSLISRVKPDIVVDTAALHNVDYCETHPEEANAINHLGTGNVARSSSKAGAKFVFISTDFVFDGKGAPYDEESTPNPESVYAKSKLDGEKASLSLNENCVVCRPAVIYSWVSAQDSSSSSGKPLNFGAWLVSQLQNKKEVKIVTDQITSPTLADDLAQAILALSRNDSARGVFHTAGATSLSRFDFSVKVAKRFGLDEKLVHPIDSSSLKQVAKRPLNSSLVSKRLSKYGYKMMEIDQALDRFYQDSKVN
ncbi:MAG: dTDP-4-dehydrorhamnose reductase [Nitrososphaerales archaeon]